jgi:rubrerythrin
MDRAEVLKIANDTAEDIVKRYKPPISIEHGLAESMGEEKAAVEYYFKRAEDAIDKRDFSAAHLYQYVAKDEQEHYFLFSNQLGGDKFEPAAFKIESADIGHKALVYGKEGIITGVAPRGEWYNLKMKDGTELKHEPKANVTVLADIAK